MDIEQKFIDLINADVDGEIGPEDKRELAAFLAGNDEARALHAELQKLCGSIDAVDAASPPPHLKYVILDAVKSGKTDSPGILRTLFAMPALHYAASFLAGAVLVLSIVDSDQVSVHDLDEISNLVGTVADPGSNLISKVDIDHSAVAGQVSLRHIGSMLILDFDLMANRLIDIEADYTDRSIWFAGFGQTESTDTTVAAGDGNVTLSMEGKRRYAVYLQNAGERAITIRLRFIAASDVIHETSLSYEPAD